MRNTRDHQVMKKPKLTTEILSGLTISIALVPEAISFALLVGAPPQVGLWAAFFMALSTSLFGGRPGLISGATGATAVVMAGLVAKAGLEALPLGVIVAGLIQLGVWATPAWRLFQKIRPAAISGFLVALALMILMSQFRYLTIGSPDPKTLAIMVLAILACSAAMIWTSRRFGFPPALTSIVLGTIIGVPLGFATVGDLSVVSAELPHFSMPALSLDLLLLVLPYSFGMAVSGLTESLLTVDSVSAKLGEMGDKRQETFAQGLGNTVSGLFGSMGGCVLVGQTNLNIGAGAKGRASSLIAAIGLALIILVFGGYIERLPLIGLIGVMLVVVYETGDWASLRNSNPLKLFIILLTAAVSILTHNLAVGVIVGSIAAHIVKS
jgi:SulP family sulfate permease